MEYFILLVHVAAAVSIIVLVLLQHGKGADMGASFGSGSAGSVFGSAGSANFLSRSTAAAAAVFFATSLTLTYFAAHRGGAATGGVMQGVMKDVPAPAKGDTKADAKADAKADTKTDPKANINMIPSTSSAPVTPAPATNATTPNTAANPASAPSTPSQNVIPK
jgi:preprotein translocase subunit SecG